MRGASHPSRCIDAFLPSSTSRAVAASRDRAASSAIVRTLHRIDRTGGDELRARVDLLELALPRAEARRERRRLALRFDRDAVDRVSVASSRTIAASCFPRASIGHVEHRHDFETRAVRLSDELVRACAREARIDDRFQVRAGR